MLDLELALPPSQASRLARQLGKGRRSTTRLGIAWHDNEAGDLATADMTVVERREGRAVAWRLERINPDADCANPSAIGAVLASADAPDQLGPLVQARLMPVAGFSGVLRHLPVAEDDRIRAILLDGEIRAAHLTHPTCRLRLVGPAEPVAALAMRLVTELPLTVTMETLAAEAYATARRSVAPGRASEPLQPGFSAAEACRMACLSLSALIRHHAQRICLGELEPVHQARVSMRRLRAVLSVFKRAAGGPLHDMARAELRAFGDVLSPARDWDVFCTDTGRRATALLAQDPSVRRLHAAAERRRAACYAALHAYLAGPQFRRLGVALAALAAVPAASAEPARDTEVPDASAIAGAEGSGDADLQAPDVKLRAYAAKALSRRLARILKAGDDITALPDEALHAIRLQAKRLRYTAELFAPVFSRREAGRFIRRLTRLQDRLGLLNDGAVASGLMAELGAAGGRGFAAGVVCGLVAARAAGAREEIARDWRKLRRTEGFWE